MRHEGLKLTIAAVVLTALILIGWHLLWVISPGHPAPLYAPSPVEVQYPQ